MDVEALLRELARFDLTSADRGQLADAIAKSASVRAWLDGKDVKLGKAMAAKSAFPEKDIADASGVTMRAAATVLERGATVELAPAYASALAEGGASGARVDAVGAALRQVDAAQRAELARLAER